MKILEGKSVAENIKATFAQRIEKLKERGKNPYLAVLGIKGDEASEVYIKRIEKNCEKYGIKFALRMAEKNLKTILKKLKIMKKLLVLCFNSHFLNHFQI